MVARPRSCNKNWCVPMYPAEQAGPDNSAVGEDLIEPSSTEHRLFDTIVQAIRTVYDPEIPVNLYDLGLIYRISISDENEVEVDMTLTAPGCPVAGEMPGMVAEVIEPLPGIKTVDVQLVWDPPWDMSRLSDEARVDLGLI